MTRSHRLSRRFLVSSFVATLLIAGCTPPKSQSFRNSFLPPTPHPVITDDVMITDPPEVPADLYLKEQPNRLPEGVVTPRNAEIDNRLRRAEERYQAGQKAYQQGNMDEARREFDRAVDILLATPDNGPERQRVERRLEQMVEAVYPLRRERARIGRGFR